MMMRWDVCAVCGCCPTIGVCRLTRATNLWLPHNVAMIRPSFHLSACPSTSRLTRLQLSSTRHHTLFLKFIFFPLVFLKFTKKRPKCRKMRLRVPIPTRKATQMVSPCMRKCAETCERLLRTNDVSTINWYIIAYSHCYDYKLTNVHSLDLTATSTTSRPNIWRKPLRETSSKAGTTLLKVQLLQQELVALAPEPRRDEKAASASRIASSAGAGSAPMSER